jgi:hypothetical protein
MTHTPQIATLAPALRVFITVTMVTIAVVGTSRADDLTGRVVTPSGSGPAVVFLKGITGGTVPTADTVIVHQAGGAFDPAVSIGFVGNQFVFKNEDDQMHTTHLMLHLAAQEARSGRPLKNGATVYNIAFPIPGMEASRPITAYTGFSDDTGVIDVRCNPHPDETATLLVFDHPYAAVSGADGAFTLRDVPAGSHDVWVWHDGETRMWRTVDVAAGRATEIVVEAATR